MDYFYIIIDLSRSSPGRPCFWKDNDAGYTYNPFHAGRYLPDRVHRQWTYYNDGEETVAIPATEGAIFNTVGFHCSMDMEKVAKLLDRSKPEQISADFTAAWGIVANLFNTKNK